MAHEVVHADDRIVVCLGDCLDVLAVLPDGSVDSVVTDPPYALSFMSKDWDRNHPDPRVWKECHRLLKPGGHLLSFGGTRTWHRLTCDIEDAGFEIRDSIAWLYGSGFPKSLDVSKAIDKRAGEVGESVIALKRRLIELFDASGLTRNEIDRQCGFRACNYLTLPAAGKRLDPWVNILPTAEKWAVIKTVIGVADSDELDAKFQAAEREITQHATRPAVAGEAITFDQRSSSERERRDIPVSDAAKQWQGWGTALKPSFEPVIVARKPLQGTVAANVLQHGTGAINVDACRVEYEQGGSLASNPSLRESINGGNGGHIFPTEDERRVVTPNTAGRWPPNVVLDESQAQALDESTGALKSGDGNKRRKDHQTTSMAGTLGMLDREEISYGDSGGASRFFPTFKYQAKAPTKERPKVEGIAHPTVKPLGLIQWLLRLVTPPGGIVLDPFAGSGTLAEAVLLEDQGHNAILIERESQYIPLILARLDRVSEGQT